MNQYFEENLNFKFHLNNEYKVPYCNHLQKHTDDSYKFKALKFVTC
jgi:hypothetical protein